jgi:hypothetical protein
MYGVGATIPYLGPNGTLTETLVERCRRLPRCDGDRIRLHAGFTPICAYAPYDAVVEALTWAQELHCHVGQLAWLQRPRRRLERQVRKSAGNVWYLRTPDGWVVSQRWVLWGAVKAG